MHQIMHILPEQLLDALISQGAEASRVAEPASVFEIDSVDRFGSRIEKQSQFVLALAQSLFCLPQFRKVDRRPHRSPWSAFLIQQRYSIREFFPPGPVWKYRRQ
jgi:hypothetical protein